ncbi:hypothetical protein BOX15_Mlig028721g2, partial [Macrostomum lignano]
QRESKQQAWRLQKRQQSELSELADAQQQQPQGEAGSVCSVCGCDRPAGCHYGAVTCHACKSFFKRTVQHSLAYACMRLARHCALVSERTRACGYCRFRKCLRVGMRPQLVRSLSDCVNDDQDQASSLASSTATVAAAAAATPSVEAAVAAVEADLVEIEPFTIDQSGLDGLPLEERVIRCVTLACDGFLSSLIVWAKRVSGFNQLIMQDRVALIQRRWMVVMILGMARSSHPYTDTLHFCSNFQLSEEQASSFRLPRIDPRVRTICQRYTQLNVTPLETNLLSYVLFLESSCYFDWANQAAIEELQLGYLRRLRQACRGGVRLGVLLQLHNDLMAAQLLALGYMDRTLNLEGRPLPPLANEVLQHVLALGLPVSEPHRYF